MNKLSKKLVALFAVLTMLANLTFVLAEENQLVTKAVCSNGAVSVSGIAGNANVYLLNPGKTLTDLENAQGDNFADIVNFCTIVTGDLNRNYTLNFSINNYNKDAIYLLCVEEGSNIVTKEISGKAQKIYVSANADASVADGTELHPYNSIDAAKIALRSVVTTGNVEVIIDGGIYYVDNTIEFTSYDSAGDGIQITYKAADGEKVTLSGAKKVDLENVKKVTDIKVLSKVSSEAAEKLVEIDLAAANIPSEIVDFTAKLTHAYSAKPMGVFLNGKRQNISRWPNEGFKTILDGTTKGGADRDGTQSLGGASVKIEDLDRERAKKWANAENMYVEGYLGNTWHGEWAKVGSVDENTLTVNLDDYTKYGVKANNRIAAVNLIEEIDMPGEWYADADTMKLYYYPPKNLENDDVLEIGVLDENIMSFNDVENISIENIVFENNAADSSIPENGDEGGNGILIKNSENIIIRNCDFREIGLDGIRMKHSDNITITGCDIYSTGFSGIVDSSSGDKNTLTSSNNVISNNIISSSGRDVMSSAASGILLTNGVGTVIENNVLNDMKVSAIRYDGNLYTIKNNEIYNATYEVLDYGAVYSGRSFAKYGNVIKNNYFHDIGEYGLDKEEEIHASAVFWDDHMSGNSFIGNIVDMGSKKNTSGVKIGGGRDNTVTGNIFVNAEYPIYAESREGTFETGSEIYQSFAYAAKSGTNVTSLGENDWLDSFVEQFPEIMENYNDIASGKYYRKNVITNNAYYNCDDEPRIGEQFGPSTITNNRQLYLKSSMMDYDNKDYRITASTKDTYSLGNDILTGNFALSSIGTSNTPNSEFAKFDLLYPENGGNVSETSTVITWEKSAFCDDYTYQVALDANFNSIVASGTTRKAFAEVSGLTKNATYYWRVYANNNSAIRGQKVACEEVYSFTTNGEVKVEKVSYSSSSDRFEYTIKNGTEAEKNATVFLALKDSQGKLVDVRTKAYDLASSQNVSDYIENDFTQNVENGVIELYFWDMTSNNTVKNQNCLVKFKYIYK